MTVVIENIFDAIASSPEDAADLKLRSSMMDLVMAELRDMKLSGRKAQECLELSDVDWANFKQGGISEFSPGRLAHLLTLLGRTVTVGVKTAA